MCSIKEHQRSELESIVTISSASRLLYAKYSIDKIIFKYSSPFTVQELIKVLKSNNISFSFKKLRSNMSAIKVGYFYFVKYSYSSRYVAKVLTNPNSFSTFDEFLDYFYILKNLDLFNNTFTTQFDFACDVNRTSTNINKRLYVKWKRSIQRFVINDKEDGSRYYGNGNEIVNSYKKRVNHLATKSKINSEKTENMLNHRIEVRIKGKEKLCGNRLEDTLDNIINGNINPFKHIYIQDFKLKKKSLLEHPSEIEKYTRLETLISEGGVYYAKRKLNKNRNFNKLYIDKYIKLTDNICLGDYFLSGIKLYISYNDDSFDFTNMVKS